MIARAGSGWQTVLADLSLILFMVTAAAAAQAVPDVMPAPPALVDPVLGDPVAVWRGGSSASLAQWLENQPADARQRLTIIVPYADDPASAAAAALDLASAAGRPARLVFEPGGAGDVYATLTFDVAQASGPIARGIR